MTIDPDDSRAVSLSCLLICVIYINVIDIRGGWLLIKATLLLSLMTHRVLTVSFIA